jgi:hypothetical protein
MNRNTLFVIVAGAALLLGASASFASTAGTGTGGASAGATGSGGSHGPAGASIILLDTRGASADDVSARDGKGILVGRDGSGSSTPPADGPLMPAPPAADGPLMAAPPLVRLAKLPALFPLAEADRCGLEARQNNLHGAHRARFMRACVADELAAQ